jgi:hypothetical protein
MAPIVANCVAVCKNREASDEARERGSSWLVQASARHIAAKDIYGREHANLTDDAIRRLADCSVMRDKKRCNMQTETAIEVEAEDKLRWLRRIDGDHEWESLDDHRVCGCCGRTFSGRQAQLVGGTRGHGPVRFVCPTPNCTSRPADWRYPHERRAAAKRSTSRFRRPHVVRVKHTRHVLRRDKQRANWMWKLRHALQRHLGLPV